MRPVRLGRRLIGPLVLACSLDREQDGALPEALAVLAGALDGSGEELLEIEDLLPGAVRLAVLSGDQKAMEAAAAEFARSGDRGQAQAAFADAAEVYAALGAAADIARLQST